MIYTEKFLQGMLDKALGQMSVPTRFAAIIEGSIAVGFGNESSDMDFLLIDESEHEHPTMPMIAFIDGRRVEVRLRSHRQMRAQLELLRTRAQRGPRQLATIPDDLLDRCQRFQSGIVLRGSKTIASVRAVLPDEELRWITAEWFAHRARRTARYAIAKHVTGCPAEAAAWARFALMSGAKAWVARRGQTYLERKWLTQQLGLVADPEGLSARYAALIDVRSAARDDDVLHSCLVLLADFGIDGCAYRPAAVRLAAADGVTTWQIGNRVHLLRQDRDVFVLSRDAALLWRCVVFGVPLPRLLDRTPEGLGKSGPLIAEFERFGLVSFTWGRSRITAVPPLTPPPVEAVPKVTPQGACRAAGGADSASAHIGLVSLPADRFAAAGMRLIWANIVVENAREDLAGAIARGQWSTASVVAQRLLSQSCIAALCSYGYTGVTAEHAAHAVADAIDLPPDIRRLAARARTRVAADDEPSAQRAMGLLDEFVTRIREATASSLFPSSFASADEWRRTIEVGYDWVRLGAHLNADFPIEDARDLVASGGRPPSAASADRKELA